MKTLLTSNKPKNILVRMPNWLGDLVMATPILTDLRHQWPEAKITAHCQGILGTLIQEDPHINAVRVFKKPSSWLNPRAHSTIAASLKEEDYDLAILLTNSLSSAWWYWLAGLKNKIGYADHYRSLLLDYPIPFPKEREIQHLVITYKMLLNPLGIPVSETAPALYLTEQERQQATERFNQAGFNSKQLIVGINPGAAYGSAKCWLPERFKEVAQKLIEKPNVSVVFFGDKAGAPLVNEICQTLPTDRVMNLAGKTSLRELMALIKECSLFLTNDSGPMHMASALGVPLLALFGSTSDVATGPYQGGKVIHKHVPCSPCYRRECPIDFRCMTRIDVSEVYHELQQLMEKWSSKPK